MNIYILLILIYISFSNEKIIKNGIYNFVIDELYLYYYRRNLSVSVKLQYPNSFFRIRKILKISDIAFFNIEELIKKFKLGYLENNQLNFNRRNDDSNLWTFIKISDNNYVVKNKDNCSIVINKLKVFCQTIPLNKATKFKIIKIFSEVDIKRNITYLNLLNKEPIDILIKYIDLKDPNLKRNGIHQIEKDFDNEELRYSIRSVVKNLPWIRKIFILMPNEKVRYLKDYNLIKDKIVYIKDKDILGHESSNCNAFLYRYWKLKRFGISDNIIVMDDDCFINHSLEKSDFFYIKNGKVVPAIVTSNFIKIEKNKIEKECKEYEQKAFISTEEQNNDAFLYSKYLTYSYLLNLFNISSNESLYIPNFTHNAIPVNLNEVKEIYNLVFKSKYRYQTLECLYRIPGYLQFQIFILSYTFIKYKRKVSNIPNKFVNLNNSVSANYNISLFCLNKGAGKYSYLNNYKAKIVMEYLFPIPSPYEIVDYSLLNFAFNVSYTMEMIIKLYENQISHMIPKTDFLDFQTTIFLNIFFILFKIIYSQSYYNHYMNLNYNYFN